MSEGGREIVAMLDTLLPGDRTFPSASGAGIAGLVARRLGEETMAELGDAIAACGGPLEPLDAATRRVVVARLERSRTALFETVLRAAFLAYYGSGKVAEAMRGCGLDFHVAPQPEGYAMEPFDPVRDVPRHGRGGYLRTAEVRRVALPEGLR